MPQIIDMPDLVLEPGSDMRMGPFKRQAIVAACAEIHIKAQNCRIVIEGEFTEVIVEGSHGHVQMNASQTVTEVPRSVGSLVRVNGWDVTAPWTPMPPMYREVGRVAPEKVQVFPDKAGEFRWRRVAANNRSTAISGEGYTQEYDAHVAAERENPGLEIEILRAAPESDPETAED